MIKKALEFLFGTSLNYSTTIALLITVMDNNIKTTGVIYLIMLLISPTVGIILPVSILGYITYTSLFDNNK